MPRVMLALLLGAAAGQPFPPPRWAPTWNLTLSTVINPGITDGFFAPNHSWGLISPDWSIAQGVWMREYCGVLLREPACNSSWPGCGACNTTDNSTSGCGPRALRLGDARRGGSSRGVPERRLGWGRLGGRGGSWPQSGECHAAGRNTTTCEATSVEGCRPSTPHACLPTPRRRLPASPFSDVQQAAGY
eukprot:COSAG04_NODE_3082_length_3189_cov_1.949191_1_plen_189_part_00